jgi:hypothetical protein
LAAKGEANGDRPGSESGAKVWDGFPRNLGDAVFDPPHIASGTGLERDQALAEVSAARERTWRRGEGAGRRIHKWTRIRHGKS